LAKAKKARLKVDEVPMTVYEVRKSRFMKLIRLPYLAAISLIEIIKIKYMNIKWKPKLNYGKAFS